MDETQSPELSIILPVFNEIRTLPKILKAIQEAPFLISHELILVDDGSTDGSRAFLEQYQAGRSHVRLVLHERNRGKGAAVRSGIQAATGSWIVVQDADLEYDPADINQLLEPALLGLADLVLGSRFMPGRYRRAMYFWHALANHILTTAANMLADLNLTDMETCLKLARASLLKVVDLRNERFDIEPELVIKLSRCRARIYETPVTYRGRTYAEGKKIGGWDAFEAFWAILRARFTSRLSTHPGFAALLAMQRASRTNRWFFSKLAPYVGKEVLEVGSGIGAYTEMFLDRDRIVCVDNEPLYCERLDGAYGHLENMHVVRADITQAQEWERITAGGAFDTVLCINTLEHIERDEEALQHFAEALQEGGRLLILAPLNSALHSSIDTHAAHCRRYTEEELAAKISRAGLEVKSMFGFNRAGALGRRMFGHTRLPASCIRLFDYMLPLAKLFEHIPVHGFCSLVCIAEKPKRA